MGWDSKDVYYDPKHFGLTSLGSVEWEEPNWSFNFSVVWKDDNGVFYWGDDSGCSCPSPFQGVTKDDLSSGTAHGAAAYLQEKAETYGSNGYGDRNKSDLDADVADLISKIMS